MSDDGTISDLLDEVYFLRHILACEARILEGHLDYKTFPKTRRPYAEASVERMRVAAKGGAVGLFREPRPYQHSKREMEAIGGEQTLTLSQWHEERETRSD